MTQFLKLGRLRFAPRLLTGVTLLISVSALCARATAEVTAQGSTQGSGVASNAGGDTSQSAAAASQGATAISQGSPTSRPARALTSSERDEFNLSNDERAQIILREVKLGERSFMGGDYRDALRRFTRVYRLYPKPVIIYNMARCFEELHEYDSAVFYYRRYLKESPDSNDHEAISLTIETLNRLKQDRAQQTSSAPSTPVKPAPRTLPWTGVIIGGSMLVTSAVFGVRALSISDELSEFRAGDSPSEFYNLRDTRDQSALFADIFMISGAVLSGVSLYFLLREPRGSVAASPQATPSKPLSAIDLSVGPTGLSISGVF